MIELKACAFARMQRFEDPAQLPHPAWQARVAGVVLEVSRDPGKLHAIGVITVGAVEQIIFEVEAVELGVPGGFFSHRLCSLIPGHNRVGCQCQKAGRNAGR